MESRRLARPAPQDTAPALRYDLDTSVGYSRIDEGSVTDWYGSLTLLPELYVGKFGIGLLVDLHMNTGTGQFRGEDFNSAHDYLSLLYFVRYGEEDDPEGYGRFGSIEDASLGYGQFIDQYSNIVSLDDPMRGLVGAIPTDHFRFEALFNDFVTPGVFGVHGSYYPFGITDPASIWPQLSFGISLAGDLNSEGARVNPEAPGAPFLLSESPAADTIQAVATGVQDGNLYMVGVDAGVRWIRTDRFSLLSFAEASKIFDYGVGASLGVRGAGGVGPFDLQVQYTQRFLGKEFLPDFFGPSYEAQRIREISLPLQGQAVNAVNTRRNDLAGRQSSGVGHEIQVEAEYDDAFESTIGYETIYGDSDHGRFHLDLDLRLQAVPLSVRLGYDRFDMDTITDVFVASREDALYRLGVAYKIIGPVRLGLEVSQTYEPVYRNGQAIGREKQNRFHPFVQATFQL